MLSSTPLPVWLLTGSATSPTRAALAALAPSEQRMLAAVVFEGASCTQLARATGIAAVDVRARLGDALLALGAAGTAIGAVSGSVAAMLVLRVLDALDADEAELIDLLLRQQAALQGSYAACEELVAELCSLAPRIAPRPNALARLLDALDDQAN